MTAIEAAGPLARGRVRQALWGLARLLRAVGVCVLGGMAAGALVGGAGSRLAMRASGAMTDAGGRTLVTENGNILGRFTVDGTGFLVAFGVLAFGVVGGVSYAAARAWLAPTRRRGLVFGGLLLAAYGMVTLEARNVDFTRFGRPTVNVVLFASLYLLFGIVAVAAADRLERAVPALPPSRRLGLRGVLAVLPALGAGAFGTGLLLVLTRATMAGSFRGDPRDAGFALGIAVFVAVVWAAAIGSRVRVRWPASGRWAAVVVAVPVVGGAIVTIREVAAILGS